MDRDQIIARLRENEEALRKRGVAHAALFGSRARGDARPESDTDIMIESTRRLGSQYSITPASKAILPICWTAVWMWSIATG